MTRLDTALAPLLLWAAFGLASPSSVWAAPQSQASPPKSQVPESTAAKPNADPLATQIAAAQQALDRKDYATAIPLLRKIAAARPSQALPHFELGYVYSELKQYDQAASEYRRAIALDPQMAAAHINLGLVLRDSDPAAAVESFRRAAALLPDQGRPHYLAGQTLEASGRLAEAVEEYRSAVSLAPNDAEMRLALGRALLRSGRTAEAESQFRDAIPLARGTGQARLGLAETLLQEQKNAEAAGAFAAYLRQEPGDGDARIEYAVALQNLDRLDDALAQLDRVEQDTPPTPETLKFRASLYMQEKKWKEASAALDKAVAFYPNDAELHAWLGRSEMSLRDFPVAERELRRSLALDPKPIGPLQDLADVLYLSKQYPAALAALDLLARRQTPVPMSWFVRATCYDKLGRVQEAAASYWKFLDADGSSHPDQDFQARERLKLLLRELSLRKR
jgi:Flp pilus assembly protein TadD